MNVCVIEGRMTKDPELKMTTNGKEVCHFRLAVPRSKDKVDFIQFVAWDQNARFLENFVRKGAWVTVEGALRQVMYTDKNGNDVNSYEIESILVSSHCGVCRND